MLGQKSPDAGSMGNEPAAPGLLNKTMGGVARPTESVVFQLKNGKLRLAYRSWSLGAHPNFKGRWMDPSGNLDTFSMTTLMGSNYGVFTQNCDLDNPSTVGEVCSANYRRIVALVRPYGESVSSIAIPGALPEYPSLAGDWTRKCAQIKLRTKCTCNKEFALWEWNSDLVKCCDAAYGATQTALWKPQLVRSRGGKAPAPPPVTRELLKAAYAALAWRWPAVKL